MPIEREFPAANSYGLPPAGVQYVLDGRANASQRVGSSPGVSCTYYPSPKTGFVEQAPSRTGEFVSHTSLEDDEDVTEYWDQAPQLKLVYVSKNGAKGWTTDPARYPLSQIVDRLDDPRDKTQCRH